MEKNVELSVPFFCDENQLRVYNLNYSDYTSLEELNQSLKAYVQEKNHTFNRLSKRQLNE